MTGPLPGHLWVCVPGVAGERWRSGGLLIALRAAELLGEHLPTTVVTTHDEEAGHPTLEAALDLAAPTDVFLITWGPHVTDLLARLEGRRVVYYAQSEGWGLHLDPSVAVLALSRHLMGVWGTQAPTNHVAYLPPVLDGACIDDGRARDLDVLVLARKSTPHLLDRLAPALAEQCTVHVQHEFIDRAAVIDLYQRSRTYLYSSSPWSSGWREGFGMQPLEARACGCAVFTNLHGGLADHEDPDVDAFKIEVHSLEHDVRRVLAAVRGERVVRADAEAIQRTYAEAAFHDRVSRLLPSLHDFFEHCAGRESDIPVVRPVPLPDERGSVRRLVGDGLRRVGLR
jgi:glycosyltransferase involved in cell wall biosynthesis